MQTNTLFTETAINLDTITLSSEAKTLVAKIANAFAKKIGLSKSDYKITLTNLNFGGDITFKREAGSNIYTMNKNVNIATGMSKERTKQLIRHELTHIKQGKEKRLYIDGSSGRRGGFYWEGKKYMSVKSYNTLMTQMSSKNISVRVKAEIKYRKLPWEKEAEAAAK